MRARTCLMLIGLMGCEKPAPPPPPPETPKPAKPAESMALPVAPDLSIWFGDGRDDTDEAGQTCRERVLVIHRDTTRLVIPLLYTGTVPTAVNDSTIEAELWVHCKMTDRYRVNLRTAQPTRVAR